jgi:hypothetical protein
MVCSCSDGGFLGHIHDGNIGEPSGEQCGCSGGVYPQDAAGDSGLGTALTASRSGVRTGRAPLRSGLHVLEREGEGAKICGADVLVSMYVSTVRHGGCGVWVRSVYGPLGSLVNHSDNMIGSKKTPGM